MSYSPDQHLKLVPGFPDYSVSRFGRFFHNRNGNEMTLSPNQRGELTVGLVLEGIQYRRSAKLLVAQAWVPGMREAFTSPIQLDGDRNNVSADNLAWRPRWFAWKYQRQLTDPPPYADFGPILEVTRNQAYETIRDAALLTGTLMSDIMGSLPNETYVFPDALRFVYLER